ncbi:TetR/AcrR family transcriptional regulator [Rhizobium leguminosarum]|uniref:TetR/AcrR family transcriptional regulator n=1 Tax=Rhizobium leguminosarum TaxID=384 RepID=UPI001CDBE203|nr:TetR/AcrR family transcriptional regulator [Rhizobium leguminosarum]
MNKPVENIISVGRPREFEIDIAVRKAMDVFWRRGFHDASLPDLLDGMEISRGSFYKAFVDKRDVFLRALDVYIDDAVRKVGDALHSNPSPKAAIREAFSQVVEISSGEEGLRGCFGVLAAVEMLPDDVEVTARISKLFRRLQDLYAATLIRAQTLGEIDPKLDERTLARFLVCQIQGMRVLGKVGAGRSDMKALVDVALKPLD